MKDQSMSVPDDLPDGTPIARGRIMLPTNVSTNDLFNELHRRLITESELFVACNRPTSSMMVAVCDQIDEAHHVYTDLTTNPVEAS